MLICMIVFLAEITFTTSEIQHWVYYRNPQNLEIFREAGQIKERNLSTVEHFIDKTSNPDDASWSFQSGYKVNPPLPGFNHYNYDSGAGLRVKIDSPKDSNQNQKENPSREQSGTNKLRWQRNDEPHEHPVRKRKSPDDEYMGSNEDDPYVQHEKRGYQRGGGMMSQMSLGFGALTDKTMMYGPGPGTSGNMAGGSFNMKGQDSKTPSLTSGPFTNSRMSQAMFPPGLTNNQGGVPNGLSAGGASMSSFPGSGSMTGSPSKTPFNMAMLSMQSQGNLSPSMGGMSMNSAGAKTTVGQTYKEHDENESSEIEKKIVFGDTISIQYVNGKIIVPKTWSLDKVKALQSQIESGHAKSGTQSDCPKLSANCPQSCIVFNNHACPVCSCADDICPDFPAGCRRGNVHINKDGCPVCVSKDGDDDWYKQIWNT